MHIVIVGAGIIGLVTAFELHAQGIQITLCDPNPAEGASHAAAGMLAPASEIVWGQDGLHELMAESARCYPDLIARIERATGHRPAYRENPTMVVAAENSDRQALEELQQIRQRLKLPAESLLGSQARDREPALAGNISGALVFPQDHQVDPRSLCSILIQYFRDQLVRERVVEYLPAHDGTAAVRTESGQVIRADQVLLCTGVEQLKGTPRLPLRPVYGDILRLDVPTHLQPLLTHTVRGVVHRRGVYLVPRADGSIVLGASVREDGNQQVSIEALYTLLDDARRLVPGIMATSLREVIARARPATPDDAPIIDRVDPRLVVSNGYFRHGILLAALGAKLGAQLVLSQPPDPRLPDLSLNRFTSTNTNFKES